MSGTVGSSLPGDEVAGSAAQPPAPAGPVTVSGPDEYVAGIRVHMREAPTDPTVWAEVRGLFTDMARAVERFSLTMEAQVPNWRALCAVLTGGRSPRVARRRWEILERQARRQAVAEVRVVRAPATACWARVGKVSRARGRR